MAKGKTGKKLPRRMIDPTGWSTEKLRKKRRASIKKKSPEKLHDFKKDLKNKQKSK